MIDDTSGCNENGIAAPFVNIEDDDRTFPSLFCEIFFFKWKAKIMEFWDLAYF